MRPALALCALAAGCGAADRNLMPLNVGDSARYAVSADFVRYIGEVKVVRRSAVAGLDGYVLAGPMGESHLAWKGDTLIGDRFSNTRFVPAIPLVVATEDPIQRTWKGTVQGAWGKYEAVATLAQRRVKEVDGKKIDVVKSELTITSPNRKAIKLVTTFQPGVGIYSQRQWLGGDSIADIERISGS